MKDHLISLVEAVRLARLELKCQQDPNCRASEEWTLKRLRELLGSTKVSEAMAVSGTFSNARSSTRAPAAAC